MSLLKKLGKSDYRQVSEWARKELIDLRKNSKEPIFLKLRNGNYTVGSYVVESHSESWIADEKTFYNKKSAIFYCALLHLGKHAEANQLYVLDNRAMLLESDKELFRHRLDVAHKKNDEWGIGLYGSRFEETKGQLRIVRTEMEKIFLRDKYLNIIG